MEAIVTVELRFSYGYKYTSQYKGMVATVVPCFAVPMWYASFRDRDGNGSTVIDQVNELEIVDWLLKQGCKPLFMKWCMEESREFGFNPFIDSVSRLTDRPFHVYIAHDVNDDLIKVGTSAKYQNRLKSLYARKGHTFKMLGLMQGHLNTERAVCERFKEHLAVGREWFRPHQEIFDFVKEYTFNPDEPVKI